MRKLTGPHSCTCKVRHTRCDEKRPICSNCERLGLQCRPSEFMTHSIWSSVETQPPLLSRRDTSFEPSLTTSSIVDLHLAGANNTLIARRNFSDGSIQSTGSSRSTDSSLSTSASQSTSSSLATSVSQFTGASSTPSPPAALPTPPRHPESVVYLLNAFRSGVATWMDLFDHGRSYQREVCRRALSSNLLLKCICAFTAKQLSSMASGDAWKPVASQYYGESLNLLIQELSKPESQTDVLTAAMLLSSYEMLTAQNHEHQRHYEGAMKLIRTRGITARSYGLDRANFWVYIRHEISVALAQQGPLQFAPHEWDVVWPDEQAEEDQLANHLMWLVGRAVDISYSEAPTVGREGLIADIERWYSLTSPSCRGTEYGEQDEEGLSRVHFAVPAAGEYQHTHRVSHCVSPLHDLGCAYCRGCALSDILCSGCDVVVSSTVTHSSRRAIHTQP